MTKGKPRGKGAKAKPARNGSSRSKHRSAAAAELGASPDLPASNGGASEANDMMDTSSALQLPEALDLLAATPLAKALIERRGADIAIDASSVQRVGAQCAQVLLSAASTWTADGLSLAIVNRSPGFVEGLQLLGIPGDAFIEGEVQQ